MSKISYCSLEEAWGTAYKDNNGQEQEKKKVSYVDKNSQIERENVIQNMNNVERNSKSENNSIVEYNKYRLNSVNKVSDSDVSKSYTPFNESIEKKYLQDKLNFLENEFRKYKDLFEKTELSNEKSNTIENFSNNDNQQYQGNSTKSNDIIDLILLIIIGLIIIFVMNSIFNIGKSIGARHKNIL
jgi:hypothetical protein